MDDKELKYWENKLRLFRVLHPDINISTYCGKCISSEEHHQPGQPLLCGKVRLLEDEKGKLHHSSDVENGGWCMEFIKYE
jgi:hypothetical protein